MKKSGCLFIISISLMVLLMHSCRIIKQDSCDCLLPKNLKRVIDEISKNPDSTNFIDLSKVLYIVSYKIEKSNYISVYTSPYYGFFVDNKLLHYGFSKIERSCIYKGILIFSFNLNSNELIKGICDNTNLLKSYYSYIDSEDKVLTKDYLLEGDKYIEVDLDSISFNQKNSLFDKYKLFALPPPPPPPIE